MDCSASFAPEPSVTAALKALSTQQLHYSLSTQAQPWNWTSTPECHTAFSTWLVRFPVPRKMMPGLYHFRGQQVGDYSVFLQAFAERVDDVLRASSINHVLGLCRRSAGWDSPEAAAMAGV